MLATWGKQKPPVGSRVNWGSPLTSGLKGYWPINEGAGGFCRDIAAGQVGAINGSVPFLTGGINFSASSANYVRIPYIASRNGFGTSDFSIFLDFMPRSAALFQIPIGKDVSGGRDWSIDISGSTAGKVGWYDGSVLTEASQTFSASQRLRVFVSRIGPTRTIYINGQVGSSATDSTNYSATNDVFLGRREFSGFDQAFDGIIFQTGIWIGRGLSANDVAALTSNPNAMFVPPSAAKFYSYAAAAAAAFIAPAPFIKSQAVNTASNF